MPIEGLMGRILGDVLLHYFNLIGAYIVAATVVAVALYLSTAFSFSSARYGWRHASPSPLLYGSVFRTGVPIVQEKSPAEAGTGQGESSCGRTRYSASADAA